MPNDTLEELARSVVEELRPDVAKAPHRANEASAIATLFRPYLQYASTGVKPPALYAKEDRRIKRWRISLELWTNPDSVGTSFDELVAISEGRIRDSDGELMELGGDVVEGLDAAAHLVEDFAGELSPSFQLNAMCHALQNLRPTISRQGGSATMRRTSDCGEYHLIMDIQKETD
jgi:hypothetical protein